MENKDMPVVEEKYITDLKSDLFDMYNAKLRVFENDHKGGALYFLYKNKEIVYVGATSQLKKRMSIHRYNNVIDFDIVRYLPINSDKIRRRFERLLIEIFRPKENIFYNPIHYNKIPAFKNYSA